MLGSALPRPAVCAELLSHATLPQFTGCNGVMLAEAVLERPAVFDDNKTRSGEPIRAVRASPRACAFERTRRPDRVLAGRSTCALNWRTSAWSLGETSWCARRCATIATTCCAVSSTCVAMRAHPAIVCVLRVSVDALQAHPDVRLRFNACPRDVVEPMLQVLTEFQEVLRNEESAIGEVRVVTVLQSLELRP